MQQIANIISASRLSTIPMAPTPALLQARTTRSSRPVLIISHYEGTKAEICHKLTKQRLKQNEKFPY